jgi:uncharacterized protein (DUF2249 family)
MPRRDLLRRVADGPPKPLTGSTAAASLYVQLSRVQSLQQLSIMRDFDAAELQIPLSQELVGELEWEEQMDKATVEKYSYMEQIV